MDGLFLVGMSPRCSRNQVVGFFLFRTKKERRAVLLFYNFEMKRIYRGKDLMVLNNNCDFNEM